MAIGVKFDVVNNICLTQYYLSIYAIFGVVYGIYTVLQLFGGFGAVGSALFVKLTSCPC